MSVRHNARTGVAAAAGAGLAGMQLLVGLQGTAFSYVQVLVLALCAATTVSVLWLVRSPSFEARLAVVSTAVAAVGATLLAVTVGLPGGFVAGSSLEAWTVLLLGTTVPVLLAADRRRGHAHTTPGGSYAP